MIQRSCLGESSSCKERREPLAAAGLSCVCSLAGRGAVWGQPGRAGHSLPQAVPPAENHSCEPQGLHLLHGTGAGNEPLSPALPSSA